MAKTLTTLTATEADETAMTALALGDEYARADDAEDAYIVAFLDHLRAMNAHNPNALTWLNRIEDGWRKLDAKADRAVIAAAAEITALSRRIAERANKEAALERKSRAA